MSFEVTLEELSFCKNSFVEVTVSLEKENFSLLSISSSVYMYLLVEYPVVF